MAWPLGFVCLNSKSVMPADGVNVTTSATTVSMEQECGDGGYHEAFKEYCLYARRRYVLHDGIQHALHGASCGDVAPSHLHLSLHEALKHIIGAELPVSHCLLTATLHGVMLHNAVLNRPVLLCVLCSALQ